MMLMENLVTSVGGEVPVLRNADQTDNLRTVEGYAAVYDVWILRGEWNGFTYREMDQKGLFDQSLRTDPKVALKVNHTGAFAATWANTLSLRSDEHGLFFQATLNTDNPMHLALVKDMESGLLREASVAFWKEDWETQQRADGEDVVITRADLDRGDVSVCLFGMNPAAWSSLKRTLDTDAGRQVLRSLGYAETVADSAEIAPTSDTTELVQEVLEATDFAEPASNDALWEMRQNLRLLQLETGVGVKELVS